MSNKPHIICLSGFKKSGKTTASNYLVVRYGYQRHALADPIKAMLAALGCDQEQLYGGLKESPASILCGQTPRHAMQTLGTEWGRKYIADDFWLRRWYETRPSGLVVCDDVRFPNEAEWMRSVGAVVWRIERPGCQSSGHESESYQIIGDATLENLGTAGELENVIDQLISEYGRI